MKKNMAICFFGLHYYENFPHFSGVHKTVNYKCYVKNIKTKIYNYFEKDYNIDTFLSTDISPLYNDLLNSYSPVRHCIEIGMHEKKLRVLELLLQYINESKKKYDTVLLTRFDIYIVKNLTNENLDLNKFNIVSMLNEEGMCDDNLFIFPINYLKQMINIIKNKLNTDKSHTTIHLLKNTFEKSFNVNYICNEKHCDVANLSFFKLRFFYNKELIINKYLFSENIAYESINNTSQIIIQNDIIEFKKNIIEPCWWAWFGYEFETTGLYNLSFEIYSNKNIINYDFIKIHKPQDKFYKTLDILANTWTKINVTIEITEVNDFLCFIFDEFNDNIEIIYKNICFKKYNQILIKNNSFIENIKHIPNDNSKIIIRDNVIVFNKNIIEPCWWTWFGYEFNDTGLYNLSFEIYSNKNIINYDFIKIHKPQDKFYKTPDILANTWTKINVTIEITEVNDLLCFIFDEFNDNIEIFYKNICL